MEFPDEQDTMPSETTTLAAVPFEDVTQSRLFGMVP
jgi:hypothetical protein